VIIILKNRNGFIPIVVYAIFIGVFSYANTKSLWVMFFGLLPYIFGGAGIITFFVGLFVQKYGKTTSAMGRVMYGILIFIIAFWGCIITYGLKDSGRIDLAEVWREDTYYTLMLSFVGVMLGQFFEARKEKKKKESN
jgi:Na+/H+-translocating membrane pyrophosphatase